MIRELEVKVQDVLHDRSVNRLFEVRSSLILQLTQRR